MPSILPRLLCSLPLLLVVAPSNAQSTDAVRPGDDALTCADISQQRKALDEIIAAGDPNAPSMTKAAAGTAANVGGQVAGMLGGLGGLVSKVTGAVAQQQVEQRMAPDAAAQQKAAEAKPRQAFLVKLEAAKGCKADDPAFAGKALSAGEFQALSSGPAAGEIKPLDTSAVSLITEPLSPLVLDNPLKGDLKLGNRTVYISEFRVLYEVGGTVTASTRAGYFAGRNYGATNSTIKYKVANADVAALQALTDKAWNDLRARFEARGLKVVDRDAFVAQHGEIYPATEAASTPTQPVYLEDKQGYVTRRYLVTAPTGMKLHPRGIAGLGAGNIGKRIEFVKNQLDGFAIGIAVNVADLESSGSRSSILATEGANTSADQGMVLSAPPGGMVANGHAEGGLVQMPKGFAVPGAFARIREVGGYDTQKDALVRSVQIVGALAGVAANTSKTLELELDLDGPSTTRMAMQGLVTFNQALVERMQTAPR